MWARFCLIDNKHNNMIGDPIPQSNILVLLYHKIQEGGLSKMQMQKLLIKKVQ